MSMPGGYQPHYQQPYPPANDGSGTKTILLILGIVGGIFLVIAIGCGVATYLFVSKAKRAATEGISQFEEKMKEADEQFKEENRRRSEPPADLNAAIRDLSGNDINRHTVALNWLKTQNVASAQRNAVATALMGMMNRTSSENKVSAVTLLDKWGDPSLAPQIAESLRYRDEATPQKLDLLAKYKDMSTAVKIAEVLEDSQHGAKAKETLKKMGPETAGAVAEHLGSGNGNARNYAKELLKEFNVDFNAALVKLQIERLKGDSSKQREAAVELAVLEVDPKQQPAIVQLLNETLNGKDTFLARDVLAALLVWGDKSTMEPLVRAMRAERVSGFDFPKAFKLIEKFGGETEIPILIEHIKDYNEPGDAATNALIKIGPACQDEVVGYFNSDERNAQINARRILTAFEGNGKLIVGQCVKDLKTGKDRVAQNAVKWLAECDVIEDQRAEVTTALAAFMQGGNVFVNREASQALSRWASAEQKDLLLTMLEDKDEEVWTSAYVRLLELQAIDELKQPTGVMLADFFRRRKVSELLRKAGPTAEPLAIAMLDHSEEDALVEACGILAVIGGEASLKPLENLLKKAQRVGSKKVIDATKKAGGIVTVRVRDAKKNATVEPPEKSG